MIWFANDKDSIQGKCLYFRPFACKLTVYSRKNSSDPQDSQISRTYDPLWTNTVFYWFRSETEPIGGTVQTFSCDISCKWGMRAWTSENGTHRIVLPSCDVFIELPFYSPTHSSESAVCISKVGKDFVNHHVTIPICTAGVCHKRTCFTSCAA